MMRQWSVMAGDHRSYRILVIQEWTTEPQVVEASLRAAGLDATITRVDFLAALNAALVHERFDAAIYDPARSELSIDTIKQSLELNGQRLPLVVVEDAQAVGAQVQQLLRARRN